jgi:hypothetical protein
MGGFLGRPQVNGGYYEKPDLGYKGNIGLF